MHDKPKKGMYRRLLPRRQLKLWVLTFKPSLQVVTMLGNTMAMHDEFHVNDGTVCGVHV